MGRMRSLTPRQCLKDNCQRKHYAKGYCKEHYQQKWYINKVNSGYQLENKKTASTL